MGRIPFAHYNELVRYNTEVGELFVFDQQNYALARVEGTDEHSALLEALARIEPLVHAFALGYTMALTAREWRERPTDVRRGALIQMAERLKAAMVLPAGAELINAVLDEADGALMRGQDAEKTIAKVIDERVRLADRAADRCGRHAVNLIDGGDRVLTCGFAGPALLALLGALPVLEPPAKLQFAGKAPGASLRSLVESAGIEAQPIEHMLEPPTLCIVVAWALARDGSAVCASGCGAIIEQARQAGVPCYVLAPFGPHPDAEAPERVVSATHPVDIVLPSLISAIVTDRGMYRPAMIERYLGESDAPPDVIPLM